jgi:hypothetical protein
VKPKLIPDPRPGFIFVGEILHELIWVAARHRSYNFHSSRVGVAVEVTVDRKALYLYLQGVGTGSRSVLLTSCVRHMKPPARNLFPNPGKLPGRGPRGSPGGVDARPNLGNNILGRVEVAVVQYRTSTDRHAKLFLLVSSIFTLG